MTTSGLVKDARYQDDEQVFWSRRQDVRIARWSMVKRKKYQDDKKVIGLDGMISGW